MRPLIAMLPLCFLLAGCGACKDGTPTDKKPMLVIAEDGTRYFVEHHMGCVFSVREVQ